MANAQTSDAVTLMDIPTELLDQIASLLPRSALRALALTSKKANTSAIDTLYKTYLNRTAPAKAPFHLFLRTICERPDLAAKVKRVDIRGWRSEYEVVTGAAWRGVTEVRDVDQAEKNGPSFTSTEKTIRGSATERFKLFVEAAVKAGLIAEPASLSVPALKSSIVWYTTLKEDGDFLRLLGRGVEDAQLVLMLALLSNMDILRIDGLSPFPLLDWHQFLSHSSTALRLLSGLLVKGSRTCLREPVVKNSLQFLDIMPNLLKMHLSDIAAGSHRFTLNALPSSRLGALILIDCGVSRRLFLKMLHGQHMDHLEYKPAPLKDAEVAGSDLSVPEVVAFLRDSNLSLKKLMLFPASTRFECNSLKMFQNLQSLDMPQPGVLAISDDELEAENISSLVLDQLPNTLRLIRLRYLTYSPQTKIIMGQLASLKIQGVLPKLKAVCFNFQRVFASSYLASLVGGGPVGGLATGTAWDAAPDMEPKVREDFGKLYEEAGICMFVEQTDW